MATKPGEVRATVERPCPSKSPGPTMPGKRAYGPCMRAMALARLVRQPPRPGVDGRARAERRATGHDQVAVELGDLRGVDPGLGGERGRVIEVVHDRPDGEREALPA